MKADTQTKELQIAITHADPKNLQHICFLADTKNIDNNKMISKFAYNKK